MPANENDLTVYAGLFEYVKDTLEENTQKLNCDEKGYLKTIGTAPKTISYNEFKDLEGEAFLSYVFMAFFQRLPVDEEIEKFAALSKEEILKYDLPFIQPISKILTDCPSNIKPGLRGKIFGLAASVATSPALRKAAKKMPSGIQNKIRGAFR